MSKSIEKVDYMDTFSITIEALSIDFEKVD